MMATLQDILSPQARIDGLAQTPVADPLAATAPPSDVAASGPGPIGLQPHPVPSLSTRVPTPGRALYGPSRILGETYGGGAGMSTPRAPTDPNAGLASRIAQAATSPEAAPSGFLATPTGRGIRAVLYGLGQTLPATSRGLTGVLGSAGRGFTATVDDLQAQRAQQVEAQQAQAQRAFQSQLGQAQLGLTQAQTNAYQKLADQREAKATDPGDPYTTINGVAYYVDPNDPTGHTLVPVKGQLPKGTGSRAPQQTPAEKMFAAQTQKYLNAKDPVTGAALYSPEEAAGLAAQGTMAVYPKFTVAGYQPAKQPVTDADIAALTSRMRANGNTPAQIQQAVAAHRSAGRPRVVGFTPPPAQGSKGAAPDALLRSLIGQGLSDTDINARLVAQGYDPEQ